MTVGLGSFISGDKDEISLAELVERMERRFLPVKELRSRGFELARTGVKCKCKHKSRVMVGTVYRLSREEIMLEEIKRFAKNKPMIIIGFIMTMMETGYEFREIGSVDLYDLIVESGFSKIALVEVKRVMEKIKDSDLLGELVSGKRVGLQKAYKLYR